MEKINTMQHSLHILGHVVLMTGYDETNVYVHDNSKTEVQIIPIAELELAWAEEPQKNHFRHCCLFL